MQRQFSAPQSKYQVFFGSQRLMDQLFSGEEQFKLDSPPATRVFIQDMKAPIQDRFTASPHPSVQTSRHLTHYTNSCFFHSIHLRLNVLVLVNIYYCVGLNIQGKIGHCRSQLHSAGFGVLSGNTDLRSHQRLCKCTSKLENIVLTPHDHRYTLNSNIVITESANQSFESLFYFLGCCKCLLDSFGAVGPYKPNYIGSCPTLEPCCSARES
jgi:hypothetical protein